MQRHATHCALFTAFFLLLVAAPAAQAQNILLLEDFEDGTVEYTTSEPEFNDGTNDFFIRTDGSNISSSYQINNVQGSSYFGAQDLDGEGATLPLYLTFSGIDISSANDLFFNAFFAEDDDGTNEDYDSGADFVNVQAQVDGGGYIDVFCIIASVPTDDFNNAPVVDANCDGTPDGPEITDTMVRFSDAIGQTGNTLDIRIAFQLDSGDEDIAIDNFSVTSDGAIPVEFAGPPLAAADGNAVTVRWTTYSEENNLGFYIQHQRAGQSGWTEAQQRVDGAGTTTARNDYDYTVRDLSPGPYTFRVRQVDTDATESFSQTVEATVTAEGFTLQAPRQNPFQGRTELTYADEGAQNVQAALYNSLGQRVRTLRPASGVIAVEAGSLASGLYFVRLTDGAGRVAVQSLTLVR